MLKHTFVHIPGIGSKTEQRIWEAGILDQDQWQPPLPSVVPAAKRKLISYYLERFAREDNGSPLFHTGLLPTNEHWRIFPRFRGQTAYLDIETNGMGREECEITTIALYDGTTISTYVQGENLEEFADALARYRVLVTYNGKGFDIPVIEHCLRIRINHAHIDLRHVLASLGYRGGLKGCEKQLGIERRELDGVDGYFAVLLWQEYRRSGDRRVLETLLAYNIADAVNLERLLVHAYNEKIVDTPFRLSRYIPLPAEPELPLSPDPQVIAALLERRLDQ